MERNHISEYRYERLHFLHTTCEGRCFLQQSRYPLYGIPDFSQWYKNVPTIAYLFHDVCIAAKRQDYSIRIHIHNIAFSAGRIMICGHDLKIADSSCADKLITIKSQRSCIYHIFSMISSSESSSSELFSS